MHLMHHFACRSTFINSRSPPELARIRWPVAIALKPTHEAGRRGGESTARQRTFAHLFSQPERVAVPRGFVRVSVGDAGASEGLAGF
ncbi:TPA: hypothetical protein MI649_13890 [Klebsiella pneumoniae]|nr:hypothetical protein [Klebsiella pneumoniae]HBY7448605.1 hypothetical protein [Klebsiella pneumoniae]